MLYQSCPLSINTQRSHDVFVRLWPRFGQALEEPDTARDSRPEVKTDAFEASGEIRTSFPFVSFQNADSS